MIRTLIVVLVSLPTGLVWSGHSQRAAPSATIACNWRVRPPHIGRDRTIRTYPDGGVVAPSRPPNVAGGDPSAVVAGAPMRRPTLGASPIVASRPTAVSIATPTLVATTGSTGKTLHPPPTEGASTPLVRANGLGTAVQGFLHAGGYSRYCRCRISTESAHSCQRSRAHRTLTSGSAERAQSLCSAPTSFQKLASAPRLQSTSTKLPSTASITGRGLGNGAGPDGGLLDQPQLQGS